MAEAVGFLAVLIMKNTLDLNQNLIHYYDIDFENRVLTIHDGVTCIIPEMFKDVPFVSVFDSVQIPSSVKIIDKNAFQDFMIKRLIIPEGVKYIEDCAINMGETEEIYLPSTLIQIGSAAFRNIDKTNIKKFVIGNPKVKFENSFNFNGLECRLHGIKNYVGYKAFRCLDERSLVCRNFYYEEGKTYEMDDKPQCCIKGFHFCKTPVDCFKYYNGFYNYYNDERCYPIVVHEVYILGDVDYDNFTEETKGCTNKIKIGRSLTLQECFDKSIEIWQNLSKK